MIVWAECQRYRGMPRLGESQEKFLNRQISWLEADRVKCTPGGLRWAAGSQPVLFLSSAVPQVIAQGATEFFSGVIPAASVVGVSKEAGAVRQRRVEVLVTDTGSLPGVQGFPVMGEFAMVVASTQSRISNGPIRICLGEKVWPLLYLDREGGGPSVFNRLNFNDIFCHELTHGLVLDRLLRGCSASADQGLDNVPSALGAGAWEGLVGGGLFFLQGLHRRVAEESRIRSGWIAPPKMIASRQIDGVEGWVNEVIWALIFRNLGNEGREGYSVDLSADESWRRGREKFLSTAGAVVVPALDGARLSPGWLTQEVFERLSFRPEMLLELLVRIRPEEFSAFLPWGLKEEWSQMRMAVRDGLMGQWEKIDRWSLPARRTSDHFVADRSSSRLRASL